MAQAASMKHIEYLIERLNARLDRPATGYTRNDDGTWTNHDGHIYLTRWSPGDGWTRYQLAEVSGSGEAHVSRIWNRAELYAYLTGLHAALDLTKR